jgi:hypothetical protein
VTLRIAAVSTLLIITCVSAPVLAQTPAPPSTPAANAGMDYHGDYVAGINAFDRVLNRGETTTYAPGWFAGASYRIIRVISVVGEIGGDYKKESGTSFHLYTFSGGARFQSGRKAARARPFAQILLGTGLDNGNIGQSTPTNHFPVVTPGGGVDVRLSQHAAARVKLDFPLYATFGDVHKGLRLAFALWSSRNKLVETYNSNAFSARSMMKQKRADGSFPISSLMTRSVTI